MVKSSQQPSGDADALKLTKYLAIIAVFVIVTGFILTFLFRTFVILPCSVVIMGIIVFFGILRISKALKEKDDERGKNAKEGNNSIHCYSVPEAATLAFRVLSSFKLQLTRLP